MQITNTLQNKEQQLKEKEKQLEAQFKVVQLDSHDVNTWREVDVVCTPSKTIGTVLSLMTSGHKWEVEITGSTVLLTYLSWKSKKPEL